MQGDWQDTRCSPSNCIINTISPHTPFSPFRERQEPPTIRYIPQFDYKFNPNQSPLNYPSPNMTFYNPYTTKSCKRTLNISGSSVGSRSSPRTKRIRQNFSSCLETTDQSKTERFGIDDTLDKTCIANDVNETDDKEVDESDLSNANLVCENCPDLLRIVGVCTTCTDQPYLCQLCVDAHKRVRITREHVIHILAEQSTKTCWRSVPQILETLIELIDTDLDDSIASETAKLVKTWNTHLDEFSVKEIALDMKHSEEVIEAKLIPVLSHGLTSAKLKAIEMIQKLMELRMVNVSSAFANDKFIEGFEHIFNSDYSEVIVVALDCLQCIVKEVTEAEAKFSLIKLHSKLEKQLKRLKLYEMGYTTSVQYKAGNLLREMEKYLMD